MRRLLSILFLVSIAILVVDVPAFAHDSSRVPPKQTNVDRQTSRGEAIGADGFDFTPDGLVRDVFNLMTGIQRPLDGTTSMTVQAGKGLKIGLTF